MADCGRARRTSWFSSLIMQDANYLASSEIYACERPTGALHQHAANTRGGSLRLPAALPSGTLRAGDAEIGFDPARDLAILDEHKSFLPYRTNWLWGTFAARSAAGVTGANQCARPALPGEEEESCVWVRGACEPLAGVAFTSSGTGPLAPWRVASADGRVDVTFTEGRKGVRHQLGLFEIDYFQLYGTYRGTMRGRDGTSHPVEDTHGVLESMRARL